MISTNAAVSTCRSMLTLAAVWLVQSLAIAQVTQPGVVRYEYDAEGNLTRTTNPLGHATSQAWDSLGRIMEQTLPSASPAISGPKIRFEHDQLDQLTKVTDPRNLVTSYHIDGTGNKSATVSPDTGTTFYTTDPAGNIVQSKDARGLTTRYAYDALNRLVSATYAAGTPSTF